MLNIWGITVMAFYHDVTIFFVGLNIWANIAIKIYHGGPHCTRFVLTFCATFYALLNCECTICITKLLFKIIL